MPLQLGNQNGGPPPTAASHPSHTHWPGNANWSAGRGAVNRGGRMGVSGGRGGRRLRHTAGVPQNGPVSVPLTGSTQRSPVDGFPLEIPGKINGGCIGH